MMHGLARLARLGSPGGRRWQRCSAPQVVRRVLRGVLSGLMQRWPTLRFVRLRVSWPVRPFVGCLSGRPSARDPAPTASAEIWCRGHGLRGDKQCGVGSARP
jgi:hypothetical protein